MTRRAHVPTEQSRTLVRRLSGLGMSVDDVARLNDISDVTVRKYYMADVERGRVEANMAVANALFKAATREHNPSVPAAMFWLKNRAGWKEPIVSGGTDDVTALAIEFVGPRAIIDAVRATQSATEQAPTISGVAERVEQHSGTNGASAGVDTVEDTATVDENIVGDDLFEVPLPDPDPDP